MSDSRIADTLRDWYRDNARVLPWRTHPTPYRVWVSEVMLQQTRVETVLRYYEPFLDRFPTVEALANATNDDVLLAWNGLGFYRRAEHLHAAARIIRDRFAGVIPTDPLVLRSLPGFGYYLTGAVASIGLGQRVPAIDGNIERILSRLYRLDTRLNARQGRAAYESNLMGILPENGAGDLLQALMDLGSAVCIRTPHCGECPLAHLCESALHNETALYPVPAKRTPPREVKRIVVLDQENGILLHRRPNHGLLRRMWEFPGVDASSPDDAIAVFRTAYTQNIRLTRRVFDYRHVFSHVVWHVEVWSGVLFAEGHGWTRVDSGRLSEYPIPSAFRPILDYIRVSSRQEHVA